jgi:hypothetical protein
MMRHLSALLLPAVALLAGQPGGGVEGRVTSGLNGQPLKRAYVVLRGLSSGTDAAPAETYVCQTGADGRFSVADVAPGRYEAEASHDGFQAKPPDRAASPVYFPQFTVEAGGHVTGIDLHLTPLGMLAGAITSDAGDPVANTVVEAMQNRYSAGRKVLTRVQQVQTDDRGEYRFSGLPPGRYYLRASNSNQDPPIAGGIDTRGPARTRIYMPAYYPAAQDASQAVALDVAPAAEMEHVDFRIRRVFVYSIRGTAPADADPMLARASFGYASAARSGENHEGFELYGIPPGIYAIRVSKTDPATRRSTLFAFRRVEIGDQDIEGLDLTRPTGREISGTVQLDGAAGPLESLRVLLQPEEAGAGTQTDCPVNPDGSFTITGQPDAYVIRVQAPAGAYLKSVRVGERERPNHRLNPGSDSGKLSLVVAGDAGRIEGSVTGADGKAIARATVTLIPDQSLPFWTDLAKTGTTGATGSFILTGVVPGAYKLYAWTDVEVGAPQDADFRKPFESQALAVQVDPSGSISVKLTAIDPGAK